MLLVQAFCSYIITGVVGQVILKVDNLKIFNGVEIMESQ